MKLELHPTTMIVELNTQNGGTISARLWEGKTDHGTPVHAFVTRLVPTIEEPLPADVRQEFERVLRNASAPSPAVQAYDLRLFID